jgi:hypothetical protein
MGDTLDYLENNVEELGNEACGLPARHREYKPDRMGVTKWGHPKTNETVMHFDISQGFPACFIKMRSQKWQMTGTKRKVTCKNCRKWFKGDFKKVTLRKD